jgi:hypothetical protein
MFWAFDEVLDVCSSDPKRAWALTISLIATASNPRTLSDVSAGAREDLLKNYGSSIIDRLELPPGEIPNSVSRYVMCGA